METNLQDQPFRRFETTDLSLASYLRCRNFVIEGITHRNGKTSFAFSDSIQIRSAILEYANDGLIGARSFCNTLRDLKALAR